MTIVELVVTSAVLLVALAAALSTLGSATRTARFADDRGQALDDLRVMAATFSKDVRQATQATEATPTDLVIDTYLGGTLTTVTWSASATELTRQVGSQTPTVYVIDLTTPNVFSYYGDEAVVSNVNRVRLSLATQPDPNYDPVVLQTDVEMRNVS